jgi:hypothetical protein
MFVSGKTAIDGFSVAILVAADSTADVSVIR